MIHLFVIVNHYANSGNPDAADITGNTALHHAAINGHTDCVSFLVNFGVNLWGLNNDYQTAKDTTALIVSKNEILEMLDAAMAKQSALNPKSVKKAKEKALLDSEKRIRIFEKLQKKAIKKAEKDEKEMEKKRKKLLIFRPATDEKKSSSSGASSNGSTSNSSSGQMKRDSLVHLFESKSCSRVIPRKYSEIVNSSGSRVGPPKAHSLGAVSKRILHKKLNVSGSMLNLSVSTEPAANDNLDFKISQKLNPDSGYFSKSSVRSLSGLKRDRDVLYVRKADEASRYENMYHSMNQLSLKNQSWIEMFNKDNQTENNDLHQEGDNHLDWYNGDRNHPSPPHHSHEEDDPRA